MEKHGKTRKFRWHIESHDVTLSDLRGIKRTPDVSWAKAMPAKLIQWFAAVVPEAAWGGHLRVIRRHRCTGHRDYTASRRFKQGSGRQHLQIEKGALCVRKEGREKITASTRECKSKQPLQLQYQYFGVHNLSSLMQREC